MKNKARYEKPAGRRPMVPKAPSDYEPTRSVSATEAARNLSDLLNRVLYRGETFIIERGGEAVGELRPASAMRMTGIDLVALLRSLPHTDEGYGDVVEEVARSQPALPGSPWEL